MFKVNIKDTRTTPYFYYYFEHVIAGWLITQIFCEM